MDILIFFAATFSGVFLGIITGLIPGIHVNTIASLMVGISAFIYSIGLSPLSIAAFIAAVAVTHAFFDYIPTLFLGIPNDETFALLPGHQMVKEGRGLTAINLSLNGSGLGIILSIAILVTVLAIELTGVQAFSWLENFIKPHMFWILVVVSLILILSEDYKLWALFIFLSSGLYGLVVLSSPLLPSSDAAFSSLFPALAGIFGISGIILSLFDKTATIPDQKIAEKSSLTTGETYSSSIRGASAGMIVGLLPGLGGANAATLLLLVERFIGKTKKTNNHSETYIVTTSAINTSDTLFGIAALYFIEKSRSGASVAMSQLFNGDFTKSALISVICSIAIASLISYVLIRKYSKYIAHFIARLDFSSLNIAVLIFLSLLIYFTTGLWGIIVMIGGTLLGMLPPLLNVRRAQAMGFFLMPVILFYSGSQREITTFLLLEAKVMPPESIEIESIGMYVAISIVSGMLGYFIFKAVKK